MNTITLYLASTQRGRIASYVWMARHSDPKVRELFGTSSIPTPFTDESDGERVRAKIAALNPGVLVMLEVRP